MRKFVIRIIQASYLSFFCTACLTLQLSTLIPTTTPILTETPTTRFTQTPVSTKVAENASNKQNATPTAINIFDNPNQITDSQLKISIALVDKSCHKLGDTVPIHVTYENLTDTHLKIADFNFYSVNPLFGAQGWLPFSLLC